MKALFLKTGIFVMLIFTSGLIYAQIPDPPKELQPESTISVIAKSFGDSITIRWAPSSIDHWINGNRYGYNIYRYTIVQKENTVVQNPERKKINSVPILPLTLNEIEKNYSRESYPAIVAQAIYGSTFNLDSKGENVNLLNMASELSNRYSFALFACDMSLNAAKSHGLIYTDTDIEYGNKYVYVIRPNWKDSISKTDSVSFFISVNDTFKVGSPMNVFARFNDKTVEVSWDYESQKSLFTAFHIERSDDEGKTYRKINRNPLINVANYKESVLSRMIYMDTIPENGKPYYYRVLGITPFGEISPPSEEVSGYGTTMLVGVNPIIIRSDDPKNGSILIKWEFPENFEKEIKGFTIERADKSEGIYTVISDTLPRNIRSFLHTDPQNVNYYQVCAISNSNHVYCSFPSLIQIPDSLPPSIPVGLEGTIDSAGVVTLTWKKNREKDFMSYKIYRSNFPEDDYIQINSGKITDTEYSDTIPLNNLSKHVFYSISAQDHYYNESDRSFPLKIMKPDTIPPVSPVIKNFVVKHNQIFIDWLPSSSSDVVKHIILRKKYDSNEWQIISGIDSVNKINTFIDSALTFETKYNYKIIAIDESGIESANNTSITVQTGFTSPEESIKIRIATAPDGKSVKILWKTGNPEIDKILIFKATEDNKFVLLSTCTFKDEEYTDYQVKTGQTYHYRYQTKYMNGKRSNLSENITITL